MPVKRNLITSVPKEVPHRLPLGTRCVTRGVTLARGDVAYLLRLARATGGGRAGVSGELHKAILARRRLRHDLRGQLNALQLTAECVKRNVFSPAETTAALEEIAADIAKIINPPGQPEL